MERIGTEYGGWSIPSNIDLSTNSIVYSGGIGEDISFDILLNYKYDCNIYLIDPTIRSYTHYKECINFFQDNNNKFSGNIQSDYYNKIINSKPNFNKIFYYNIGLWNKKDKLKFYRQYNENNVSQSVIDNMFGDKFDLVEVDSIKNIMNKNGHVKIDLLKLDIEGAEIDVLEQMLDDKIYPKYLCIEFDLKLKNKDLQNRTDNLIFNRLLKLESYRILINDNYNITFERN